MAFENETPGLPDEDRSLLPGLVSSEFAAVQLSIDHNGNGPRLKVEDLKTGQVGFLDALELETLAWLPEGGLHKLLDPSLHRWREPSPGTDH